MPLQAINAVAKAPNEVELAKICTVAKESQYAEEMFFAASLVSKEASSLETNKAPAIYCAYGEQDCNICDLQYNSECQSTRSETSSSTSSVSSAVDSETESSKSASVKTTSLPVPVNTQRIKTKRVEAIRIQEARDKTRIIQREYGIVPDYLSSSALQ